MESIFQFVRTTFRGALVVLVPMLLILFLGGQLVRAIRGGLLKLSGWLPDWVPAPATATLITIVLVCFLIGVLLRTRAGTRLVEWLETRIFERIPGYGLARTVTRQLVGMEDAQGFEPVLAEMEGGFVVAFQVEEYDNGFVSLFMPASPSPTSGSVFLYPKALVHPVNVSLFRALRCVSRWGNGAEPLLKALGSTAEGAAVLERIRTRQP